MNEADIAETTFEQEEGRGIDNAHRFNLTQELIAQIAELDEEYIEFAEKQLNFMKYLKNRLK